MSNHVILIADHANVRTITVNRPDKLNALNQQTMQALDAALQRRQRPKTCAWSC